MADTNKIRFGFKSVAYSLITTTADTITYAAPKPWKGARSITLDAQGDSSTYYADDMAYFTTASNNGYSGSLTMAYWDDTVKKDIFGFLETANGMLVEDANAISKEVALLFECQGDKNAVRHILFKVVFGRPAFEANTKEDSISPDEVSVDITVVPITDDLNHAFVKGEAYTTSSNYDTFFQTAPEVPTLAAATSD